MGQHFVDVVTGAHPLPEYGSNAMITTGAIDVPLPGIDSLILLFRLKSFEKREIIATIPVDRAPYMHSFALTKKYAVLFADPVYINYWNYWTHRSIASKALEFDVDKNTTVYVVSLTDGQVVKRLTIPSWFHCHHVNAYELNHEIFIDYVTYPNLDVILKRM